MELLELLKPCPFCGSKGTYIKKFDFILIGCSNVGCLIYPSADYKYIGTIYHNTRIDEAIQDWNTRVKEV